MGTRDGKTPGDYQQQVAIITQSQKGKKINCYRVRAEAAGAVAIGRRI